MAEPSLVLYSAMECYRLYVVATPWIMSHLQVGLQTSLFQGYELEKEIRREVCHVTSTCYFDIVQTQLYSSELLHCFS